MNNLDLLRGRLMEGGKDLGVSGRTGGGVRKNKTLLMRRRPALHTLVLIVTKALGGVELH